MLGPRAALVVALLFSVNAMVFAQDRAILYPGAGVELNGKTAQTTSAVVGGDAITTATGSAQLIEKGATVHLQPRTSIKYGDSIALECGGVAVNGATTVHVNNNDVVPAGASPRFEVVNREGRVLITVQSGVISVGGETVSAGGAITRPGTAGCAGAPAAAQAPGRSGTVAVGAAAVGGAAVGTCLAWWCKEKHKDDVSPWQR